MHKLHERFTQGASAPTQVKGDLVSHQPLNWVCFHRSLQQGAREVLTEVSGAAAITLARKG